MRVIIGLGNPGSQYARTRHNAGFWVIDELAHRFGVTVAEKKWKSVVGDCRIGSHKVILCKPQTFMNLSGEAVSAICSFYSELNVETDLIILYDDMDFAPGQLKLRETGSAGGHNGIKSLIQHLGSSTFGRIRLGIGRPEPQSTIVDYVLSTPPANQADTMREMVARAADAVEFACQTSFSQAMNRYNAATE